LKNKENFHATEGYFAGSQFLKSNFFPSPTPAQFLENNFLGPDEC
jgi:hypothetical protein